MEKHKDISTVEEQKQTLKNVDDTNSLLKSAKRKGYYDKVADSQRVQFLTMAILGKRSMRIVSVTFINLRYSLQSLVELIIQQEKQLWKYIVKKEEYTGRTNQRLS